jgi:hypothetical protein
VSQCDYHVAKAARLTRGHHNLEALSKQLRGHAISFVF